jgi:hypothetical protein
MLRSLFQGLAALAALAMLPTLHAQSLVQLEVIDRDTGQTLPSWSHRGQRWIEGTPGHGYALRLTNLSGARVLVVVSVDGVNVVSGQDARVEQAGYVLAPWQTTEVAGWRKSLQEVARFVFTDLHDSYAARTGRADNVGVIGVAAFGERAPVMASAPRDTPGSHGQSARAAAAAPKPGADAAAPQRLGTGHGRREWAPVDRTGFIRASDMPHQQMQLRYDSHAQLLAQGVLPRHWHPPGGYRPQAFAQDFVPDP